MKIRVIDITSSSDVKMKASAGTVIIMSREHVKLSSREVGFLEGKRKHHYEGIFMQGGIINAGWEGHLSIEFLVIGEVDIKAGDEIAHAIIIESDSDVEYNKEEVI